MAKNNVINRYSKEELAKFKSIILSRLELVKQEIIEIKGILSSEENSTSTKDEAFRKSEGLQKRELSYNNAILRIGNGTYGICPKTKKRIQKERLKLVPETVYSVEAAQLIDS